VSESRFNESVVWITGASAGIGRAVARELSDRGASLALSARRRGKLEALAEECGTDKTLVAPLDVTEKEKHEDVVGTIIDHFGQLDAVVFNAGVFGTLGERPFDADTFEWNMDVNYRGIIYGIEASLPYLRESNFGHVTGMSSAAAYTPMPRGSAYGSSKVAVKYLFDSLAHEWDAKGVNVSTSVVCPGVVKTPMTEDEDFPYKPPPSFFEVTPEWSAKYIVNRIEKKTHEIRFPFLFVLSLKFLGLLPNPFHRWILKIVDRMNVKDHLRSLELDKERTD
jgi:short-subunit dehydrogenase